MIQVRSRAMVTWQFDGAVLHILYQGSPMSARPLPWSPIVVPVAALADLEFEERGPSRLLSWLSRGECRLRLRPRTGADPFTQVAGGQLPAEGDPFQITVGPREREAAIELLNEVHNALRGQPPADQPVADYLVAGPDLPLHATVEGVEVGFDGQWLRMEHNPTLAIGGGLEFRALQRRVMGLTRGYPLSRVERVEWHAAGQHHPGMMRLRLTTDPDPLCPQDDVNCVEFGQGNALTGGGDVNGLLGIAAAITALLPHPLQGAAAAEPERDAAGLDSGLLLRRLRELAALHREGVLTRDEFAAAKQGLIARLHPAERVAAPEG